MTLTLLDRPDFQPKPIHPYRPPEPHAVVESIDPGSIAAELGIQPGDEILSINGQPMEDVIDYRFLVADEEIEVTVAPAGDAAAAWVAEIEKEPDETLGVTFRADVFDGIRICTNNCDFCFVYQNRRKMRKSVYVKDDDYRLSFLHGDFITLTNLTEQCWERILRLRLSPLYVSIHATDPETRAMMLRNGDGALLWRQLDRLFRGGIEIHGQVVLTPGMNDGALLDQTVTEMSRSYGGPSGGGCRTLAIVPVGLTGHRARLPNLRSVTPDEARDVIRICRRRQRSFLRELGTRFVFPSDEMYLLAGEEPPGVRSYEDLPQQENGVGMVSRLRHAWKRVEKRLPEGLERPRHVTVVTGTLAAPVLQPLCDRLNSIVNLQVTLLPVPNRYFGEPVSVAGLAAGEDIAFAAGTALPGDALIVPSVALRGDRFIDDWRVSELQEHLGIAVLAAEPTAEGLALAALGW